jgi:hypothetical protein
MEQWTEYLVAENDDVALRSEGCQALEDGFGDCCASGIVWVAVLPILSIPVRFWEVIYVLDDYHFCILFDQRREIFEIRNPSFLRMGVPQRHFGACTARYLIELLIRWILTDNMITPT